METLISSSNSRDFDIDIPINDREETIEEKIEGIRFLQYIKPLTKVLDQHRKEYIQYVQSLIREGAEEISVDGQVVYKKY